MNKTELINEVSQRTGSTKAAAENFIRSTIEVITESVAKGEKVILVDFGTFKSRSRKGRQGRNPATGEPMDIPPVTFPAFSAGKAFREKVNG